jgi:D-sedoheptulose 7-phosphate isomerase
MNYKAQITGYIKNIGDLLNKLDTQTLEKALGILEEMYKKNKMVLIFGNGGSAATASHIAEDLSKGTSCAGKPKFRAVSLTDSTPLLTAISNDISVDAIFEHQLEILLSSGDCVLAISASGNSKNVINGVNFAKSKGAKVLSFTGFSGGKLKGLSDANLHVNHNDFGPVEDLHLMFGHIIAVCLKEYISKQ